jgi:hypothetical protein
MSLIEQCLPPLMWQHTIPAVGAGLARGTVDVIERNVQFCRFIVLSCSP